MGEEKKKIRISVKGKIAYLLDEDECLVCGNNDYEVVFDFDNAWDGESAKTAVFVYNQTTVHQPFVGNVCEGVSIENATLCAIGVFAGNLKTTTGAAIPCKLSIRDIGGVPNPPKSEVYDEIMELLNKALEGKSGLPVGGKTGQVLKKNSDDDYDTYWAEDEKGVGSAPSEEIENINKEIASLKEKNTNQDTQISSIQTQADAATNNIVALEGKIGDIDTALDAIIGKQRAVIGGAS